MDLRIYCAFKVSPFQGAWHYDFLLFQCIKFLNCQSRVFLLALWRRDIKKLLLILRERPAMIPKNLVIHCVFLVIGLVTLVAVVMLLSIILNDKLKDNQIILVDEEWNDVRIKSGHFFWTLLFKTALGHYPTSPCSTPLWLSNLLDNA